MCEILEVLRRLVWPWRAKIGRIVCLDASFRILALVTFGYAKDFHPKIVRFLL
jgi:hypothetical protein